MDFDKPKVYGDTSITDGLVVDVISHLAFIFYPVQHVLYCIVIDFIISTSPSGAEF